MLLRYTLYPGPLSGRYTDDLRLPPNPFISIPFPACKRTYGRPQPSFLLAQAKAHRGFSLLKLTGGPAARRPALPLGCWDFTGCLREASRPSGPGNSRPGRLIGASHSSFAVSAVSRVAAESRSQILWSCRPSGLFWLPDSDARKIRAQS